MSAKVSDVAIVTTKKVKKTAEAVISQNANAKAEAQAEKAAKAAEKAARLEILKAEKAAKAAEKAARLEILKAAKAAEKAAKAAKAQAEKVPVEVLEERLMQNILFNACRVTVGSLRTEVSGMDKQRYDRSLQLAEAVTEALDFWSREGMSIAKEIGLRWNVDAFCKKVLGMSKGNAYKLSRAIALPAEVREAYDAACEGDETMPRSIEELLKFAKKAEKAAGGEGGEGDEGDEPAERRTVIAKFNGFGVTFRITEKNGIRDVDTDADPSQLAELIDILKVTFLQAFPELTACWDEAAEAEA